MLKGGRVAAIKRRPKQHAGNLKRYGLKRERRIIKKGELLKNEIMTRKFEVIMEKQEIMYC